MLTEERGVDQIRRGQCVRCSGPHSTSSIPVLAAARSRSALCSGAGAGGRLGAQACGLGQSLTSPLRAFLTSEWGRFHAPRRRVGNTALKRFYRVFVARGNTNEQCALRKQHGICHTHCGPSCAKTQRKALQTCQRGAEWRAAGAGSPPGLEGRL